MTITNRFSIDASTQSIMTVSYEHHEIHGGSHFEICDVVDLSINNVFDVQFTTPDTNKHIHMVWEIQVESKTDFLIYEGATISTAGTAVTPINNNRNSLNTSGATIASILNTTTENANADTAVATATELQHSTVGAGVKSLGATSRTKELILKRNTIYCFRIIATAAGYVNYCAEWYEHTPKS